MYRSKNRMLRIDMKILFIIIICCLCIYVSCTKEKAQKENNEKNELTFSHPLSIEYLRSKSYPGTDPVFEDTVYTNESYAKYIISYVSDGMKLYAALAVPHQQAPSGKFPVIMLNHGYIPPDSYNNTKKYVRYIDYLARQGFIVCMPDYRGHGKSEGSPSSPYFSNGYLTDVLKALNSVLKLDYADSTRIGFWGHSMGGTITQQAMVVDDRIKAGVIWGGVIGTYEDMFYTYQDKIPWVRPGGYILDYMHEMEEKYGAYSLDNDFWHAISPIAYIDEISGPVQLHHARYDPSVPVELSIAFSQYMEEAGKHVELYIYNSSDHNIGDPHFEQAMQRISDCFNLHLKKGQDLDATLKKK